MRQLHIILLSLALMTSCSTAPLDPISEIRAVSAKKQYQQCIYDLTGDFNETYWPGIGNEFDYCAARRRAALTP